MLFNPRAAQTGGENDPSTLTPTSASHPAAAKQAATVHATPNGPIRKAEAMGKCQSAVAVGKHPRLNSWQTWGVFIIFFKVARGFNFSSFFFLRQHTHSSEWFFLFLSLTSLHTHASLHNFSALLGGVAGREGAGGRRVAARDPTVWQPLRLAGSRGKVLYGAIAKVGFNQFNC